MAVCYVQHLTCASWQVIHSLHTLIQEPAMHSIIHSYPFCRIFHVTLLAVIVFIVYFLCYCSVFKPFFNNLSRQSQLI